MKPGMLGMSMMRPVSESSGPGEQMPTALMLEVSPRREVGDQVQHLANDSGGTARNIGAGRSASHHLARVVHQRHTQLCAAKINADGQVARHLLGMDPGHAGGKIGGAKSE